VRAYGVGMPRAPRIEFSGALYHVMNRGNHRQRILGDDKDREMFLATLAETCQAAGWGVHSFVLMSNHYHLLIETMRAKLVKSGEELLAGHNGDEDAWVAGGGAVYAGQAVGV
jgi:hypothetical protein